MSEIRLVNVSRAFSRSSAVLAAGSRGLSGGQADRAFADRVATQSRQEFDLRHGSGDIPALDGLNVRIPDGQTIAVVGPSGCGKSTLLRVVAGLDAAYTGEVLYDGADMRDVPPKDRFIGMVFQNYALYPHFEGEGNLRFSFRVRKAPDEEANERIRVTSEIMGIGFEQLLERRPGTLSGGQQQRLAIARALVRNPKLFLFDEPLSNLDAKLRMQTRIEIKRLLRRFTITSIYVTHDQTEAISLGDQIAVMREGKIEQVGPYAELYEQPVNAFVAGFLGGHPMNLLTGTVVAGGLLQVEGIEVPLPMALLGAYPEGRQLIWGIRPEGGRLAAQAGSEADGATVSGEVDASEADYVHRVQYLRVRLGGSIITVMLDLDQGWRAGETIDVFFPTEALHFFDPQTGRRVS